MDILNNVGKESLNDDPPLYISFQNLTFSPLPTMKPVLLLQISQPLLIAFYNRPISLSSLFDFIDWLGCKEGDGVVFYVSLFLLA